MQAVTLKLQACGSTCRCESRREALGESHVDTIAACGQLVAAQQAAGQPHGCSTDDGEYADDVAREDPAALHRTALAQSRAALGEAHPESLVTQPCAVLVGWR